MSFFKNSSIEHYSLTAHEALLRAFASARNRSSVSRSDKLLVLDRNPMHLRAVNHEARVIWGKAICRQFRNLHQPGTDVFLLTVCDIRCATSVNDAGAEIAVFKPILRRHLRGFSYLGALEPAYYTNVQKGARVSDKKCVFWHLHAVAWGISRRDIKKLADGLNEMRKHLAVAPGIPAVHQVRIKTGDLASVVGYVFKPPATNYRLSRSEYEVRGLPVHRFWHHQDRLRPGERVRLFHLMKQLCFDELAVAGGDGRKMLSAAKRSAWKESGLSADKLAEKRRRRRQKR
jgi:hypothetical protein